MGIEYTTLGDSGLYVAPIIVGCMSYGKKAWADWVVEDEDEVMDILKKCYDSGLRTFDTADVYSNGQSEILLGKFIKKYNIPRNRIQILSKCFFVVDPTVPDLRFSDIGNYPQYEYCNAQGLSRKHILEAVEASTQRLGTYIDVLQIHRLDAKVPKVEIMKALNDVVNNGWVRYLGASSMKATEFVELQYIADKYNWNKFISMQSYYNLINRQDEDELIPFANNNLLGKVGLIPWSPIARGILARPVGAKSETSRATTDRTLQVLGLNNLSDADKTIINRVEELASKHNVSMAVVSTSWVISKGCHPIVGLSSTKRVDDILNAIDFKLTEEELLYLEEPYVPKKPIV